MHKSTLSQAFTKSPKISISVTLLNCFIICIIAFAPCSQATSIHNSLFLVFTCAAPITLWHNIYFLFRSAHFSIQILSSLSNSSLHTMIAMSDISNAFCTPASLCPASNPSSSYPAQSINCTLPMPSISVILLTQSEVLPRMSETILTFSLAILLTKVDLPLFIFPKMPTTNLSIFIPNILVKIEVNYNLKSLFPFFIAVKFSFTNNFTLSFFIFSNSFSITLKPICFVSSFA